MKNIISTGYEPRPLQQAIHSSLKRFNVLVCHRRFGKTVLAINEIIDQSLRNTRKNPRYAYVAPTYGQAKRVAWDYLKEYTRNFPEVITHEQDLAVTIPRPQYDDKIKITLLGSENPDSIRGIYLDGAVIDEIADCDPRIFSEVVRPALSDRLGWCIFIGTPKGTNHFFRLYELAKANILSAFAKNTKPEWFCQLYKASQTGVIPVEELESMRLEMSEEEYAQEMECSFNAALKGAYWGKQIEELENKKQICKVPHDPALLVDTFWDLGIDDTTTIWFTQQVRSEVRIIDYFEMNGMGLDYYARILKEGERAKYNYREHNWPHDGGSKDLSSGKERSTTMRELGVRVTVRPRYDVADSINAARLLLPRCYFDESATAKGLTSLKNYQRVWDAKNQIFQDKPKHDWASHGSDAFRLLAMCLRPGEDRDNRHKMKRVADNNWNIFG